MSRKLSLIFLLSFFFMTCFSQSLDFYRLSDPDNEMVRRDVSVNEQSLAGMIPLYDSITYYRYGVSMGSLNLHSMDKNFIYDGHGNKLASEYYEYYNQWYLVYSSVFSYDAGHRLIRNTKIKPNLVDTIQDYIYEYDDNGNRTLYERWELLDDFCIIYRETNTYDANNQVLTRIVERRPFDGEVLTFETKEVNSYQGNRLNDKFVYLWSNGAWTNDKKNTYTYNNNGQLSEMLTFKFESGNWTEKYKYSYEYDDSGNLLSRTTMTKNAGVWKNSNRQSYVYVANKKVTEYYSIWKDILWLVYYEYNYQYDENQNMVYSDSYELVNSQYLLYDYIRQEFDADNIMTSKAQFSFNLDVLPQTIAYGDSAVYTFKKVLGVDQMENPPLHLSIYPNPTSGVVTIDSSIPILRTELLNLTGEHILTIPGKSKYIDLSSYPSGVYLMRVVTHKNVLVRKIVLQ